MSIETWMVEFLPARPPLDDKEAVCMTIRHWIGLLPANLVRHGLTDAGQSKNDRIKHVQEGLKALFDGHNPFTTCICCNHVSERWNGCLECPLNFGWGDNHEPDYEEDDNGDDEGCTHQPEYAAMVKGDREPGIFKMLELWEEMKDEH